MIAVQGKNIVTSFIFLSTIRPYATAMMSRNFFSTYPTSRSRIKASGLVLRSKLLIVDGEPVKWTTDLPKWTLDNRTAHQNIDTSRNSQLDKLLDIKKKTSSQLHCANVRLKNRTIASQAQLRLRFWQPGLQNKLKSQTQDLKPLTNCAAPSAFSEEFQGLGPPELAPPSCLGFSSSHGGPSPQWSCWAATCVEAKRSVGSKLAAGTTTAAGGEHPDGQVNLCSWKWKRCAWTVPSTRCNVACTPRRTHGLDQPYFINTN